MPRSVHVPQRQNQTSCLLLEKPPQEVRAQPLTSQNGVASRCGRAAMAENRTMKEKPALCIQGMARKFVRESIIEDAATRLITQIMTEVADAHIAPRDAEIASLRAQLDEAKAEAIRFAGALGDHIIKAKSEARRRAIEECAAIADRWTSPEQRLHGHGGAGAEILALLSESKS